MIRIGDDVYLTADRYQYIVMKKGVNGKSGEEFYSSLAYCGDLKNAFEFIIDYWQKQEIMTKDFDTMKEALERLKEIKDETVKVFCEMKKLNTIALEDEEENEIED